MWTFGVKMLSEAIDVLVFSNAKCIQNDVKWMGILYCKVLHRVFYKMYMYRLVLYFYYWNVEYM
jgi:hypothetical protein